MIKVKDLFFVFLLVLFSFLFTKQINAATYYWVGGTTNSNTSNPANWNTVAGTCADSANTNVPGSSDTVNFVINCINDANVDTTFSVATFRMNVGYTGTTTVNGVAMTVTTSLSVDGGVLYITNGGVVTGPSGSSGIVIGNTATGNGTVTVTGSGSQLIQTIGDVARVRIGNSTGSVGNLNILNGATASTGNIYAAYSSGTTANITVDGAGTVWTSDNLLGCTAAGYIGRAGTAILTISNGAVVNTNACPWQIGSQAGSNGSVTVTGTGSQLNFINSSNLRVAYSGTGSLNIQDGGTVGLSSSMITVADQAGSIGSITIGSGYNLDVIDIKVWNYAIGIGTATLPPVATTTINGNAASESSIDWDWNDESGATGYKVYRSSDNTLLTTISSATSNWTQDSLLPNTSYSIYYRGTNVNGEGASSTPVSVYTLVGTPTNLSASLDSGNISLSVDRFTNDTVGQSGYYFSRFGTNSGWIQTNSWTDSGLSCGHEYTYSVKYRNGDGIETNETSITKSTNPCGSSGSRSVWTLPIIPIGGFKVIVNNGSSTVSDRNVLLNFNAGTDIKKIIISMTGDFTDSSLEDYSVLKKFDLCSRFGGSVKDLACPDGRYTIYAKFYTDYGRTAIDAIATTTVLLRSSNNITENLQRGSIVSLKSFTKQLKLGQTDSDIKQLQIFLNSDPDTELAKYGVGAPGEETNFFGLLTKKAVIRFQEKYAEEILKPWGLDSGTGVVGKRTLMKINELINK